MTKQLLSKCGMSDSEIPVSFYSHEMIAYSGNNIWPGAGLVTLNFKMLFLIWLTFRFILQLSFAKLYSHYIFWHYSVVSKLWGLDKPVLYYSYQYLKLTPSRVKQASGTVKKVSGIIAVLVVIVLLLLIKAMLEVIQQRNSNHWISSRG